MIPQPRTLTTGRFCCLSEEDLVQESRVAAISRSPLVGASPTGRTARTSKRLAILFPLVLVLLMAVTSGTCGVMEGLVQLR